MALDCVLGIAVSRYVTLDWHELQTLPTTTKAC